ncbi:MAG: CRTAC1 family protein [Planctomycetota bacterium]|nr:CRTAC1 family protein [Planctomycetota bacterium]MDA0918851.1 CRTAC1 family protein [Planctomycetota bacterium]MDA1159016.1 CRTAC1 family protein [Planctomycetota bacterium]
MPDIMGYGCAALDFDRDGDVDLIFACHEKGDFDSGTATHLPDSNPRQSSRLESVGNLVWPGTFFRQDEPGRFVKISHPATQKGNEQAMGLAVGDVNNDGWPDIYMTHFGNDRLFINQNGRGFEDVTATSGISNPRWGTSACFVDYDRDGWLDVFVTNYVDYFPQKCVQLSGVNPDFCGPQRFKATRDSLFRNTTGESPDGTIRFAEVTTESGIGGLTGKGLGVAAADFTGDGWQDIYVANDQEPNFLWVNQHDGTFSEEAILLGCATDHLGNSQASMGVCVHDFNDDSLLDIVATHIDGERNTLYLGTANGDFRDGTLDSPACRQSLSQTGFGVATADLDADGTNELLVANGRVRRSDGAANIQVDFWIPYRQPAMMYTFDGAFSILPRHALYRGLVTADFDNDGDQDIVLTSIDHPPTVVRNEHSVAPRKKLVVRAVDMKHGSRDALGAIVTLETSSRVSSRIVQTCGSYLSATVPRANFSLGLNETARVLMVTWPDGLRESFPAPNDNREIKLETGLGTPIE